MTKEKRTDYGCDVSAEVIENKLDVPQTAINFRDKKMRKASSWKYLAKWESILEEHWIQQNNKEYDYRGINLVVPKRKPSIKRHRVNVSSTKEDFLDDSYMKKSNSIECILDRDKHRSSDILDNLEKKKCVSENDLNRESLDLDYVDISECIYLLSLHDLERIGSLKKAAEDYTKQILKETNRNSDEIKTANRSSALHKPKIVGVVYKMKL